MQGWRIVETVAQVADHMAHLLQRHDDTLFLARIDLGEDRRAFGGLSKRLALVADPHRQVRLVEPLASQQRTDLAWGAASIRFRQRAQLEVRAEPSAFRRWQHFLVRFMAFLMV